jgi:hypothetical protein
LLAKLLSAKLLSTMPLLIARRWSRQELDFVKQKETAGIWARPLNPVERPQRSGAAPAQDFVHADARG